MYLLNDLTVLLNIAAFIFYFTISIFVFKKNPYSISNYAFSLYFISITLSILLIAIYNSIPLPVDTNILRSIYILTLLTGMLVTFFIVVGTRALTRKRESILKLKIFGPMIIGDIYLFLLQFSEITFYSHMYWASYSPIYIISLIMVFCLPAVYCLVLLINTDFRSEEMTKLFFYLKVGLVIIMIFPITNAFIGLDQSLSFLEIGEISFLISSIAIAKAIPSQKDWFIDEMFVELQEKIETEKVENIEALWERFAKIKSEIYNTETKIDKFSMRNYLEEIRKGVFSDDVLL